ncbi:tRNA pseudouridine(13) synthase TruD [Granulosicoccaceae sp. 1_MG-2023]|nr:tRNA pseudouridine(13) synthase TruD [Granulosicoccaceae sp. 1_MG-2023]
MNESVPAQAGDYAARFALLPRAIGGPLPGQARYRAAAADFFVSEQLGFEPAGEGEHQLLHVRKTGLNTQEVVDWLAAEAGIPARDVGLCGLKDKHAVTEQWFSLYLPGREDVVLPAREDVQILSVLRHNRKLRRGAHKGNRFRLVLRDCSGAREDWEARLQAIAREGFANYFGVQRFGTAFNNLHRAAAMFEGRLRRVKRNQKSHYLSASRSWLFNQIVAARINQAVYDRPLPGDRLMLAGSRSFFISDNPDEEVQRLADGDIHIAAPLWGRAGRDDAGEARDREAQWCEADAVLRDGLEAAGTDTDRRAIRAMAQELYWQWLDETCLQLEFTLENGVFATALLHELAACSTGDEQL